MVSYGSKWKCTSYCVGETQGALEEKNQDLI